MNAVTKDESPQLNQESFSPQLCDFVKQWCVAARVRIHLSVSLCVCVYLRVHMFH